MRGAKARGELTAHELRGVREARAQVNHETYKQMLGQVHDRMRSRAANNGTELTFQVPPLVPGRPLFKASHAARYISEKLRRAGFEVVVHAPHPDVQLLQVSWRRATRQARPKPRTSPERDETKRHDRGLASLPATMVEATRRLDRLKAQLQLG